MNIGLEDRNITENCGPITSRDEDADRSFLDIAIILARRKRLILRFTLAALLISVLTSFLLPTWYTAHAVILPPQGNSISSSLLSQMSGLGALGLLAGGSMGLKNPSDLYVAMLRSRSVEDAMIQRFNLAAEYREKKLSDARDEFESHSTVVASPKDGLIRISVESKTPQRAAEITNSYVEELKTLTARIAVSEASQRRLFFEQQLLQTKENLANAEEALKRTQQTTGMLQLDSEARLSIEAAATLRAQAAAKEVQIQTMRSFATEDNPELLLAKQQLAAIRAQMAQLTGGQGDSNQDPIFPRGKVPQLGLEYVRKLRDVKYFDTLFQLLAKQLEMAKLDEAKQGAVIQVMDPAIAPDKHSFPKRGVIVILSVLFAIFSVSVWVLVTDKMSSKAVDADNHEKLKTLQDLLRHNDL